MKDSFPPSISSAAKLTDTETTDITANLTADAAASTSLATSNSSSHVPFDDWYGSSRRDKHFRMGEHNECGIPSLLFVWDHKAGGYCREWLSAMSEECAVHILNLGGHLRRANL